MHLNVHKAFFMKATIWKQFKCLSADEQINKWYVYIYIYNRILLNHKKNEFETVLMRWMNLEPILHSEVTQRKMHLIYS